MGKNFGLRTNRIWYLLYVALAGLTVFAVARSLFIGMDADEQYAVALAYRIARGDLPVREIWDPHQTSAIFPAFLIRVFYLFAEDNSFLLLTLRAAGVLLQAGVSLLWYRTMKAEYGSRPALLTALVLFHTLPKWIVTPEFANQQLLFWILTILFLYRYDITRKLVYCVFAGLALCFTVLAYPSGVILFFPYVIWLGRRERRAAVSLTLTCAAGACVFLGILFSYMSLSDIGMYLKQILADPWHNAGLSEKLEGYAGEAVGLAIYLFVYLALGLFFSWLFHKGTQGRFSHGKHFAGGSTFLAVVLCIAVADQIRLWAFALVPNVHPQLHYLMLYVIGGILFRRASREKKSHWRRLYDLAWLPSVAGLAAVLLLTNLDLKASFVHLLPGMLTALLFWCDGEGRQEVSAEERQREDPAAGFRYRLLLPLIWVLVLIGARGYLLRADEGRPENVFCVKQKALYGAAKNVYCSYMTGYQYNSDYLFIEQSLVSGTKVLYIGNNLQLIYLMNDMEVCAASVISTPTYDERYLKYYELNPDKLPEAIIIDKSYFQVMEEKYIPISQWIQTEYDWENKSESEFLWILKHRQTR